MFRKIMVPVDIADPENCGRSVDAARELAAPARADVKLVAVLEPPTTGMAMDVGHDLFERAAEQVQAEMAKLAEKCGGDLRVETTVRQGAVYHEVLQEAEDWGADIIVMGSHRPAMRTYLLGSNAARIVRHARCSVLVLRGEE